LIDAYVFEEENYLIKICLGIFICISQIAKEKDINGLTSAINNLHLHIASPEKILKQADKLKISSSTINDLKSKFKTDQSGFKHTN
jgi:ribosomal protein S15P/S13E